jgi:serine phosphatase RsbU (regulator of sigma subunit)
MCAVISGFAVVIAQTRHRREQRLRRMTVIAEAAQHAILRATPSELDGVRLASRYVSASAQALIGGDLYDVAATDCGSG